MTETLAQELISVSLTEAALAKVTQLLAAEDNQDLFLRVGVAPGGCAGLRYELFFDNQSFPGDVETAYGDVTVVVDAISAPYLVGAVIDYADTIQRQGFIIDNPNAAGGCGCGDSFSTADGAGDAAGGCGCGAGGCC